MADDFKVGDVVVCVDDGAIECTIAVHQGDRSPLKGSILRIEAVVPCDVPCRCFALSFGSSRGVSQRFRKLDVPRTEIADRIRACRPHDVPVTA